MIVDLHTHTTASDGGLSPLGLIARAKSRGVEMLSITDHDTIGGYAELSADDIGDLQLVSGIELSCTWSGVNVHVLGLGFDLHSQALINELDLQAKRRGERAEVIASKLEKLGFKGVLDGASRLAEGRAIGRPDFARYMVDAGYVPSMNAAFDKYLGAGKVGDVKAVWPAMEEVVQWIRAAGGAAVLAHPTQYKMTNAKLRRMLQAFAEAGGEGLEICNGRPPLVELRYLRSLCQEYDLHATLGSDFHNPTSWLDLGCNTSDLGDCTALWSRWLSPQPAG